MAIHISKLDIDLSAVQFYKRLRRKFNSSFLFEFGAGPNKDPELSIIGFSPKKLIKLDKKLVSQNTFEFIRDLLTPYKTDNPLKYVGGLVGILSYDLVRSIENIPDHGRKDQKFPDVLLGLFLDGLIFDHITKSVSYFYHSNEPNRYNIVKEIIDNDDSDYNNYNNKDEINIGDLIFETTKEEYLEKVKIIKEKIKNGETYQTVLSQRVHTQIEGDPFLIYEKLRKINPSPYLFYIDLDGLQVFGSSPETLVSVHNSVVRTFPIAGTRPKAIDNTKREIKDIAEDLLNDPKEIAEHNMLVDLGRNDLGKVCEIGTIYLPQYKVIQNYSHVIHLVSIVEGILGKGMDHIDALKAVFPAGTVSGAPKVRSMEIIDEIEKMRRGPYAGAVGYIGCNNNLDTAIAIRTFYTIGNTLYCQAGGGIVFDSVPESEYDESLHKLNALFQALEKTSILNQSLI